MIKVNYEVSNERRAHDICDYVGFLAHEEGESQALLYIITDENNIISTETNGFFECENAGDTIEEFCCYNSLIFDKAFGSMDDFELTVDVKS